MSFLPHHVLFRKEKPTGVTSTRAQASISWPSDTDYLILLKALVIQAQEPPSSPRNTTVAHLLKISYLINQVHISRLYLLLAVTAAPLSHVLAVPLLHVMIWWSRRSIVKPALKSPFKEKRVSEGEKKGDYHWMKRRAFPLEARNTKAQRVNPTSSLHSSFSPRLF